MSSVGAPRHDPVPIGEIAEPPFVRLPDPATLFAARAERLRALAEGHLLAPYLRFLAALSDVQHRLQDGLADPDMPAEDALKQAREFGMPPLDRGRFTADAAFDATFERLLTLSEGIEMPEQARAALARTKAADDAARGAMVRAVLADSIPVEQLADHIFVAAALQVHFARQAARLDGKSLVPVGDGACPTCGGPPVASMVVSWAGAHNTRFCACSLCATQWNYVRIKCTLCGSTASISYKQIEGGNGEVRAEACDSCRGYVKILQQTQNPALEAVADDAASLALDLLVRELGYRRGGVNPFMLGY
jgi:FdhE protein